MVLFSYRACLHPAALEHVGVLVLLSLKTSITCPVCLFACLVVCLVCLFVGYACMHV